MACLPAELRGKSRFVKLPEMNFPSSQARVQTLPTRRSFASVVFRFFRRAEALAVLLLFAGAACSPSALDYSGKGLTNFAFPKNLSKIAEINLGDNQLTSLSIPAGLSNLEMLNLGSNQLTNLTLPSGLTNSD